MARKIAVINFKGGVGKTTLTVNLAAGLANRGNGKRPNNVLVVDVDPQAHATLYMLAKQAESPRSLVGIINRHRAKKQEYIQKGDVYGAILPNPVFGGSLPTLHLIASHHELRHLELEIERGLMEKNWLSGPPKHYRILSYLTDQIAQDYDYILFDCAPNFHWMTASAVFAATDFIIPAIPDFLSVDGLKELVYLLAEDNQRKSPEAAKKVRMIPLVMWEKTTAHNPVYARYAERIRTEEIPSWRKASTHVDRLLAGFTIPGGLQRSATVRKHTHDRRPLTDLEGGDPIRVQLDSMVDEILNWK